MRTQPPEQNPDDYDEVTRLRLQLHHAETQRDAFAAALKTDVKMIAKVAIYQAAIDAGKDADADTIGCMGVELDDVKAENARLKAEVELLTNCKSEADRLKAKVDRLKVAGEDLAHAVRTKRSIDFALEEWDRLIATGR